MSDTTTHTELEDLHRLVDQLPTGELGAARRFLEYLRDTAARGAGDRVTMDVDDDPFLRAFLDAPEDDELLTETDIAAIEVGRTEAARGEVEPWAPAYTYPRLKPDS